MVYPYTTTELLKAIKRRAMLPETQGLFSDEEILRTADDEMRTLVVPLIMRLRQDYFLGHSAPVSVAPLPSPFGLILPADAIGQKLNDVLWTPTGEPERPLPRVGRHEAVLETGPCFYVEGQYVMPVNTPSGTVRYSYYVNPPDLVATDGTLGDGDSLLEALPNEGYLAVAQAAAVELLRQQDRKEEAKRAEDKLALALDALATLLTPRVDGAPKRFVNRYLLGV